MAARKIDVLEATLSRSIVVVGDGDVVEKVSSLSILVLLSLLLQLNRTSSLLNKIQEIQIYIFVSQAAFTERAFPYCHNKQVQSKVAFTFLYPLLLVHPVVYLFKLQVVKSKVAILVEQLLKDCVKGGSSSSFVFSRVV